MRQHATWEGIAASWHQHRQRPWREVVAFTRGTLLLDLGCGSGRNFLPGKSYVGIDFSAQMLRLAKRSAERKGAKALLIRADVAALPLRSGAFRNALLVATLHTLTRAQRTRSLNELRRVMKTNGTALVTVWNKKHPAGKKKAVFVPWSTGNRKYQRYYYLFTEKELKALMQKYFAVTAVTCARENIIALVRKGRKRA